MHEVTQKEFYAAIGNLDVVLSVIDPYPYVVEFRVRHTRQLIGEARGDRFEDDKYFLCKQNSLSRE